MTNSNFIGAVYPSSMFTYVKETRTFASEMSMTPAVLRQLWNDSLDIGFGIRSIKTGEVLLFTLVSVDRDNEGEFRVWHFEAFTHDEKLKNIKAVIFNT